jgi:hypothetical protein
VAEITERIEYRVVGRRADGTYFSSLVLKTTLPAVEAIATRARERGCKVGIQQRIAFLAASGISLRESPWVDLDEQAADA